MKKIFFIVGICSIIAACSNNKAGQSAGNDTSAADQIVKTTENTAIDNQDKKTAAASSPGAQLIAKSDCLGCHKEQEKLVGPAYKDVAAKYPPTEENIDKLAKKVISGGSGVWGEVAMTPHPNLPLSDAKEMVKYILSLN